MSNNIILMGPPGAGKTVVSKILSQILKMAVIDIDDDVLESLWQCSVEEKLQEVGTEKFLELEGQAVSELYAENSIIALSGSNPLHSKGMQHLCTLGKVVYLKSNFDLVQRFLAQMKTGRIAKSPDQSLEEVFAYRASFYEKYAQATVSIDDSKTPQMIAQEISQLDFIQSLKK